MPVPRTVVDASVVVKWILPDPSRPEAMRLLQHYQGEAIRLFAPALLISEVCNAFCKRVRRGAMSVLAANEAHELLKIYSPVLVDDRDLMDEAMTLALTTGQALYDCLYLALAQRQSCNLITADEKFHHAVRKAFPNVLQL